jgi:peptide/nickel transport system permease protein
MIGFWIVCALLGDLITPHDPRATDVLHKLAPPSAEHPFGTDRLGRDVLARVIVGARPILVAAPIATGIAIVLGTTIGLAAGYFRGLIDEMISRVTDSVLPIPLVVMALVAIVALGPSRFTLIVVIGVVFTPIVSRTVRAAVLKERQLEYVDSAVLRNEKRRYILFRELLPNVMGIVVVELTVRLGYAVFAIAALSFLGFAVDPSVPDWGQDVAANYQFINDGIWWAALFPSLAIVTLIVGINLVADATMKGIRR